MRKVENCISFIMNMETSLHVHTYAYCIDSLASLQVLQFNASSEWINGENLWARKTLAGFI